MTELTLKLPVAPSTNALYANKRGGGRRKTDRYRTWAQAAGWHAKDQGARLIEGEVSVEICAERSRKDRDLDNLAKGTLDLLTDLGVLSDDKTVVSLKMSWARDEVGAIVCGRFMSVTVRGGPDASPAT